MDINQLYQEIRDNTIDKPKSFSLAEVGTKVWNKTSLHKLNGLTQFVISLRKNSGYDSFFNQERLIHNEEKYKKLYNVLSDEKSKRTLLSILKYRLTGKFTDLHSESDYSTNQYFDKDIISFTNHEIFVDCGGFMGETTDTFINKIHTFSKIYVYEPNLENFKKASRLLSINHPESIDRIILRDAGVGIVNSISKISLNGSASQISENGDTTIMVVSLDEDITEPISFIKMDVEGFEMDALKGAKQHIISEKPKLAICVYHKPDDLWEIPEYILSLDSTYKLYLRQYFMGDGENPWETVIYAL